MPALHCPSPEQLRAFHLGDLPESSLDEVARHLDACPRCETLARQLDTQVDPILKAIRGPEGEPAAGTLRLGPTPQDPVAPPAPESRSAAASGRYPFLQPATETGDLGRLGSYRVIRLLAAGGMGFVFHAEDVILRRSVALKVMKPNLTPDADGLQRFAREARLMASIKHRNLATIFQAGDENGVVYLAMELLEGESLGARLGRVGTLEAPEVLRLGQAIARGLAAVHAHGLVHRDIKPDNIWLEANDNVKILDFGLARCILDKARLTQTGLIMARRRTCRRSKPPAGRWTRSDLFSLGGLLYRACCGHEPFGGQNTMAVLAALAVATARPLHEVRPTIPRSLSDVVSRLLAKDPAKRPASAEEVIEELQAVALVSPGRACLPPCNAPCPRASGSREGADLGDPPAVPKRRSRSAAVLPGCGSPPARVWSCWPA